MKRSASGESPQVRPRQSAAADSRAPIATAGSKEGGSEEDARYILRCDDWPLPLAVDLVCGNAVSANELDRYWRYHQGVAERRADVGGLDLDFRGTTREARDLFRIAERECGKYDLSPFTTEIVTYPVVTDWGKPVLGEFKVLVTWVNARAFVTWAIRKRVDVPPWLLVLVEDDQPTSDGRGAGNSGSATHIAEVLSSESPRRLITEAEYRGLLTEQADFLLFVDGTKNGRAEAKKKTRRNDGTKYLPAAQLKVLTRYVEQAGTTLSPEEACPGVDSASRITRDVRKVVGKHLFRVSKGEGAAFKTVMSYCIIIPLAPDAD